MAVELGTVVQDRFTGFRGLATARTEYLYGCVRVFVEPQTLHQGKPLEGQWFDEQRLSEASEAKAGGPAPAPPDRPTPF